MSTPKIDPNRLDLAREFRARPLGRHSPDLQALLDIMRHPDNNQNLILVSIEPGRWVLGERQPNGLPPRLFENEVFERTEDGEWAAFKRRWQALTGQALAIP
jgi:N,N-dimethylformamidase